MFKSKIMKRKNNIKMRSSSDLEKNHSLNLLHCVKSVRIRSYSGPHFPTFGLNTERYSVFSPNTGKYGPE